jgi:hypothetical protein
MERYYNENPQVTLWKEKAFKIKSLFDQYKSFAEEYNESIIKALNDLTDEARRFNSLPWYKKLFYKFGV